MAGTINSSSLHPRVLIQATDSSPSHLRLASTSIHGLRTLQGGNRQLLPLQIQAELLLLVCSFLPTQALPAHIVFACHVDRNCSLERARRASLARQATCTPFFCDPTYVRCIKGQATSTFKSVLLAVWCIFKHRLLFISTSRARCIVLRIATLWYTMGSVLRWPRHRKKANAREGCRLQGPFCGNDGNQPSTHGMDGLSDLPKLDNRKKATVRRGFNTPFAVVRQQGSKVLSVLTFLSGSLLANPRGKRTMLNSP